MTESLCRIISDKIPDFRGNIAIEYALFTDPFTDISRIFIAEVNMRLDGTMPLSQLILRYHAAEWIKGNLHIAQLDSVQTKISDHNQLIDYLSKKLPLYRPESAHGIVVMTPPAKALSGNVYVAIGAVSGPEKESQNLLDRSSLILKQS